MRRLGFICFLLMAWFLSIGTQTTATRKFKTKEIEVSNPKVKTSPGVFQELFDLPTGPTFEFHGKNYSGDLTQVKPIFPSLIRLKETALEIHTSKPLFNVLITFSYFFHTW